MATGLVGCSEPVITSNSKAKAKASAAPKATSPKKSVPDLPIDETELTESERSRDPFRSYARLFAEEGSGRKASQREVILPEYSLDELKLIGIVTRIRPAKAMLRDPKGKGHVVRRGQFVGRPDVVRTTGPAGSAYQVNWRVDSIRDGDVVMVREDPTNPDVPAVTRVIPLRTETAEASLEE